MLYDELLDYLQNLIQAKVTQEEIGNALNVSKQAIAKKKASGYDFKNFEIEKIKNCLLNRGLQNSTNVDSGFLKYDIIQIPYIDWLPEEMRNPKYPDVVSRSISIDDWGKIESLRIVAMNGNSLENYWYKIQNKDVLLIDTSETKVNADGRGVYFATSQNNTKFWIREMTEQLDGSIEFRAYPKSEIITKVYSKQQLKEVDFKIIGKVIKNVSLKLN